MHSLLYIWPNSFNKYSDQGLVRSHSVIHSTKAIFIRDMLWVYNNCCTIIKTQP